MTIASRMRASMMACSLKVGYIGTRLRAVVQARSKHDPGRAAFGGV